MKVKPTRIAYSKHLIAGTRGKFGSIKTSFDGKVYHSKLEARFAEVLKGFCEKHQLKMSEQEKFPLKIFHENGKEICYIADFIISKGDRQFCVEAKGAFTDLAKIKMAIFRKEYSHIGLYIGKNVAKCLIMIKKELLND
jgi:predicted nuclease of restriction endonuclease-like RecB superfamily